MEQPRRTKATESGVRGRGRADPAAAAQPMADAMLRMLTEEKLRSRITAEARQRVAEAFDNRQLIGDLAELYEREGLGQRT